MVDAEHSPFQPAIDALTLRLQQRHNRGAPLVFNTYQARPPRAGLRLAVPCGAPGAVRRMAARNTSCRGICYRVEVSAVV